MSRSIRSPIRMPASKRSATISVRASLKDKSREISGYCARNRGIAVPRKKSAAGGRAVRRNGPDRLQRRLVLAKYRTKPIEETFAGRGRCNRPRRPLDQPHAEAFLEVANHFAYP